MSHRRFGLVIAAALAVVGLAGCSVGVTNAAGQHTQLPALPVATSAPVAVGDGWSFTTSIGSGKIKVITAGWVPDTGGSYPTPPVNGAYLVMQVGVTVDTGGYTVNEFDWSAVDSSGKAWPCLAKHWFTPFLPNGVVKAGGSVGGNLACDMPQGAVTVKVKGDLGWSIPA